MRQQGTSELVLQGKAESNARVSALMRRMDRSDYFKNPRLEVIQTDDEENVSTFTLSLGQDRPNIDKELDDGI